MRCVRRRRARDGRNDATDGARTTQMTRAHESFGELTKDLDMDIDDPGERALNILRRERSDPSRAPDEPTPLRLKPFDAAPGDETCVVKYTFRNELTTIGEVVEELAEMLGLMPCAVSLVHAGRELGPLEHTLTDCGVCANYVVYWRVKNGIAVVTTA